MPALLSKLFLCCLVLMVAALQSCAAGAASARATAGIYCNDEPDFLAAIKAQQDEGKKVRCMLIPENTALRGRDKEILDIFGASGIGVINAMDSMDEKTLSKYKHGIQSQGFKIEDADKDKFDGVQYVVIYNRDWKWQPEFPNLLHFSSHIELKCWWVRGGRLLATARSDGDYNWYGDYSGQSERLTEAIRRENLPGTRPIEASSPPKADAGAAPDGEPAPASK
ncbi:MAG: hypothetical protein IPK26_04565 [Planctomycetes bacterium]|nr:hypothetical protein [Planctomycetota bacterium]